MSAEKGEAMSKVDISSEAVENLAQECERVSLIGGSDRSHIAATLRAQAERIKELQESLDHIASGGLSERVNLGALADHPNVKPLLVKARNDALREARNIADAAMKKYAKATYSGEPVKVFKAGDDTNSHSAAKCYCAGEILIEIDALIEGATND